MRARKETMKDYIEVLKSCQKIDSEIYSITQKMNAVPVRFMELDSIVENQKATLKKLEDHLIAAKLQLKQKEGSLKAEEDQIRKYDTQLSQVKTNKEYASLQGEIALLKKETSAFEEQIITLLDEIAILESEIQTERKRVDAKKKEIDVEKEMLEKEKQEGITRKQTLVQERENVLNGLQKEIREVYERIVKKREGNALAKIEGENCSACRIRIRPQMINETQTSEKIILCESCSRILYTE